MKADRLIDFAKKAHDAVGKFRREFILSPEQLTKQCVVDSLNWDSIAYGDKEITKVPDDKRGVYAFAIATDHRALPPHCYVLYIGLAGRDSTRSLRARYKDYLNQRKVIKRERIALMIGTWKTVLRFFFAPVGDDMSAADLKTLEQNLNDSLLPPFSVGDLGAGIKGKRKAFK